MVLCAVLLLSACSSVAQIRSVSVDTNGAVVAPPDFWAKNSNGVNSVIGPGVGGGVRTINGLSGTNQTFSVGSSGTDFAISSSGTTHTFNIPTQTGSAVRGLFSSNDWVSLSSKVDTAGNGMVKSGTTLHFGQSSAYTSGAIPFASGATSMAFDSAILSYNQGGRELLFGSLSSSTVGTYVSRSSTPSDGSLSGRFRFDGLNALGSTVNYASIDAYAVTRATDVESGRLDFNVRVEGAPATLLTLSDFTRNRVLATPDGADGTASLRALVAADIPSLDASQITSGIFDAARIPDLVAGDIPDLDAAKITSGTLSTNRLPALVKDLGAITASAGDLFYYDGSHLRRLAAGPEGWVVGISNGVPIYTTNLADLFVTNIYTTTINATTIKVGGKNVPATHINGSNTAPDLNFTNSATVTFANASGSSNWTANVPDNAITYAKLQDITATQRVLGRNSSGSGDTEEVTVSQLLDWISSTRGAILYRGASGWAALTPGTSGHVLTSNGSGADPSYQAASGGGGGSVYVNGTNVTNPNLKDTSDISLAINSSTNVQLSLAALSFNAITFSSGTNLNAMDCSLGNSLYAAYKCSLTNNAFVPTPTGIPTTPKTYAIWFQQDSTGARTVTFTNGTFKFPGGVVPVVDTNANAVSLVTFATEPFTNSVLAFVGFVPQIQ